METLNNLILLVFIICFSVFGVLLIKEKWLFDPNKDENNSNRTIYGIIYLMFVFFFTIPILINMMLTQKSFIGFITNEHFDAWLGAYVTILAQFISTLSLIITIVIQQHNITVERKLRDKEHKEDLVNQYKPVLTAIDENRQLNIPEQQTIESQLKKTKGSCFILITLKNVGLGPLYNFRFQNDLKTFIFDAKSAPIIIGANDSFGAILIGHRTKEFLEKITSIIESNSQNGFINIGDTKITYDINKIDNNIVFLEKFYIIYEDIFKNEYKLKLKLFLFTNPENINEYQAHIFQDCD